MTYKRLQCPRICSPPLDTPVTPWDHDDVLVPVRIIIWFFPSSFLFVLVPYRICCSCQDKEKDVLFSLSNNGYVAFQRTAKTVGR